MLMKRSTLGFWIVFAIFVAAMICFLCSCDERPNNPPVARRHYSGSIQVGSINTPEHGTNGIAYGGPPGASYPDGGNTNNPKIGYWILPIDAYGTAGDIGGIKIDCRILPGLARCSSPEPIEIPSITISPKKVRTNPSGYATATSSANTEVFWEMSWYNYYFEFYAGLPRAGEKCIPSSFARRGCKVAYPVYSISTQEYGEYFSSISYGGNGGRTIAQVGGNNERVLMSSIPNTATESSFVSTEPNILPANIAVSILSPKWYSAKLDESGYHLKPVTDFYILDHHDDDIIAEDSTPYCASYQFWTADSVHLAGNKFTAVCSVGYPDTEPNYCTAISITVISDSNDLSAHIARSGWIVVAEPNGFEPYTVSADCGDILILPMTDGQTVKIEIKNWTQFIPLVAPYWLSSFRPFDLNGDGCVNFKDFLEIEK